MYSGEKVRLREYTREDIIQARKDLNDPEARRLIAPGVPYLLTGDDEHKWLAISQVSGNVYNFVIETLAEKKYIGGGSINDLDWKNRVAVIGIFIGDVEYRGKGYGADAIRVLVRFAFEQMNMNKVKLIVFSFNEPALRCYEKCGFRKEAVLRQEIYRDGQYYDVIVMGVLKDEFSGK